MDEGDAAAGPPGVAVPVGLAADRHAAPVGLEHVGQDLDEGRLAGAVLAQQRHDLAARDVEAHALQRARAAEGLVDVVETKDGGPFHRARFPVRPDGRSRGAARVRLFASQQTRTAAARQGAGGAVDLVPTPGSRS